MRMSSRLMSSKEFDILASPTSNGILGYKEIDVDSLKMEDNQTLPCEESETTNEESFSALPYERASFLSSSINVRKYLCKHCGYATMSYSSITCHFKYVHPKIAKNGRLFRHYKTLSHPQGVKKVPLMYFCQYCNYITLDIRHFMSHSSKLHSKRKANPYKQGSPVTTAANRKYLEALCLAKEEPIKSKIKAHRLLTMYHPDSRLVQSRNNSAPISCFVCRKRFPDGLSLSTHYESKHSQSITGKDAVTRNFNCKICTHICATRLGLYKHYAEAHFIDLYDSWFTPTPNSVLRKKRPDTKQIYDNESSLAFLEKVDSSLLSLLNFDNAADSQISTYHIPCVACDFSSDNLLLLLKHYKQNHKGWYPKNFELFLMEKFRNYIKTIEVSPSTAKYIEKECGAWVTDNCQLVQYYEYTCVICDFQSDWFIQMLNHFGDRHNDTILSPDCIKRCHATLPNLGFSSFLQCRTCCHVEFTRINMVMHYREQHGVYSYDIEMDEVFSMAEKRACNDCCMVGNFDALQWHCFQKHGINKLNWASLNKANEGSQTDVICCICRYTPSDDMDLISHYQNKHFSQAMTYTYSATDNLYQCLHCGLKMMSLVDIASHCDFCLSRGQEYAEKNLKYSTCTKCLKVFTLGTTDLMKWRHIMEHHCSNSIPFSVYDLPSFTLQYGFWDIGKTMSRRSQRTLSQTCQNAHSFIDFEDSKYSDEVDNLSIKEESESESEVSFSIHNIHSKNNGLSANKTSINSIRPDGFVAFEKGGENEIIKDDDNSNILTMEISSGNCDDIREKCQGEKCFRSDSESFSVKVLSPESHDFDTIHDTEDLLSTEESEIQNQDRLISRAKQTARKSCLKKCAKSKTSMCCRYCLKYFAKDTLLKTHILNEHDAIFSIRCFSCDATFTEIAPCIIHHKNIHGIILDTRAVCHFLLDDISHSKKYEDNFVCVWCGYQNPSKISTLNHFNSHHVLNSRRKHQLYKDRSYSCRWCEYITKNITSMRAHIDSKHGKMISYRSLGNFTCTKGVASDSSDSDDSDYKPPTKYSRKYKIGFHGKGFLMTRVCKYKDDCEYHNPEIFRRSHNRYKHRCHYPFVCVFCKKCYICSTTFLNHCRTQHKELCSLRLERKHIIQLPEPAVIAELRKSLSHCQDNENKKSIFYGSRWPCLVCLEEFHSLEDLQKHSLGKHSGKRTLMCRYCEFLSLDEEEIVRHVIIHNDSRTLEIPVTFQGEPNSLVPRASYPCVVKKSRATSTARKSIRTRSCSATRQDLLQAADDRRINSTEDAVQQLSCKFCCYSCEDVETLDSHLADFHKIKKNYQLAMPAQTSEIESGESANKNDVMSRPFVDNDVIYITDSEDESNGGKDPKSCQNLSTVHSVESKVIDSSNLTCPYCGFYSPTVDFLKLHMQRHET